MSENLENVEQSDLNCVREQMKKKLLWAIDSEISEIGGTTAQKILFAMNDFAFRNVLNTGDTSRLSEYCIKWGLDSYPAVEIHNFIIDFVDSASESSLLELAEFLRKRTKGRG